MADRTHEFQQLTRNFTQDDLTSPYKKPPEIPKNKSAFIDAAADIAKGIQQTSKVLSKLTKLIRRQGLFDDPTEEINTLVFRIKEDLSELNTKCDTAQQYIDSQKTNSKQQSSAHSLKVVGQLKSELMNATKDFKTILEVRTSKIKDQQKRKMELTGNGNLMMAMTPMKTSDSHLKDGKNSQTHLHMTPYSTVPSSSSSSLYNQESKYTGLTGFDSSQSQSQGQDQQQSQQLLVVPPGNLQYYESREQAVTEVEKTIIELGGLFKRLSTMIAEQSEMVERIDEDVENAVVNADRAHDVLLKMYNNASSNRGLYTKIIGILIIFIIFFIIFLM